MGGKKKRIQKVTPKAAKGGPKRRVTAAERAKQAELGIAAGKASRSGANQRRERARRRQKQKTRNAGCWAKFKRRFLSGPVEVDMNRRSQVVVGDAMLLPEEIRKLKVVFDFIDLDMQGGIDFEELFETVGEPRTPFTDIVFTLVDDPQSKIIVLDHAEAVARAPEGKLPERVKGQISFDDFLQLVATYCLYNREDMLMFCFQAFDNDASGVIDEDEFVELCATVNNMNPTYPGNFMRAMTEFDKNEDGMIDFEEFQLMNRRYPLVLFPIFRLQDLLQKATLGEKGWLKVAARVKREKQAEKYKRLHNGQLPPMPILERLKRKLCCCIAGNEPVPGTWNEIRARKAEEAVKGRKKGKKGKKGKGGKGGKSSAGKTSAGRAGATREYH